MRKLNESYISHSFNDLYNLDIYKYCFLILNGNTTIESILNKVKDNQIVKFDVYILYLYVKLCQQFIKLFGIKYIKNTDKAAKFIKIIDNYIQHNKEYFKKIKSVTSIHYFKK